MTLEEILDYDNRIRKLEKKQKIQLFINNTLSLAIIILAIRILFN